MLIRKIIIALMALLILTGISALFFLIRSQHLENTTGIVDANCINMICLKLNTNKPVYMEFSDDEKQIAIWTDDEFLVYDIKYGHKIYSETNQTSSDHRNYIFDDGSRKKSLAEKYSLARNFQIPSKFQLLKKKASLYYHTFDEVKARFPQVFQAHENLGKLYEIGVVRYKNKIAYLMGYDRLNLFELCGKVIELDNVFYSASVSPNGQYILAAPYYQSSSHIAFQIISMENMMQQSVFLPKLYQGEEILWEIDLEFRNCFNEDGSIVGVFFQKSGRFFSWEDCYNLTFINTKTGKILSYLYQKKPIGNLCISANNTYIAVHDRDRIKIYDNWLFR